MNKLKAKNTIYNDPMYDVVVDSRMLEQHLKEKDQQIAELKKQLAEHNEFFNAFNCKNFNEFKDFLSTFMLTPHEEQTLIRELKQQLAEKDLKIIELETKLNLKDKETNV